MATTNVIQERKIGKKYSRLLQSAVRNAINQENQSFKTLALKTKVGYRIKNERLQRLVLNAPKQSFVHHYGVETIRSNGRKLSLKARNHLDSFKQIQVMNSLATEIGDVRAEEVIAQINFK